MSKIKFSRKQPGNPPDDASKQEVKNTLKKAKYDSAVQQALKKEEQPARPGDLSPIHNTKETGTSGGDQREKETNPEDIQ
jgi:hypothetical protein